MTNRLTPSFSLLLLSALLVLGCTGDDDQSIQPVVDDIDLTGLPYQPVEYSFDLPDHFRDMPQPEDNRASVAGVQLGRMLFFDPILSADSTISCSSCHKPELAFTDGKALSTGINGGQGPRSSMSLVNVGLQSEFFWDGRSGSLEEQSLHPVEDPLEMGSTWPEVELRLRRQVKYQEGFRAAFGIEKVSEIDRSLVAKAVAQFERSITSGDSAYDRIVYGLQGFFSVLEEEGKDLYFREPTTEHPGCAHCHNAPTFADIDPGTGFHNNGLTGVDGLEDFPDLGRGAVTGSRFDNGKFRATTLRNIALTAPYMHDGSLATLDDVLDHYASGGHYSPSRDVQILGFPMDARRRAALKAFLLTLTDTTSLALPRLQAPE